MRAQKAPTSGRDKGSRPTYEALRAELAKSKTELAALEARAAGTTRLVGAYRAESQQLDQKEVRQQATSPAKSQ